LVNWTHRFLRNKRQIKRVLLWIKPSQTIRHSETKWNYVEIGTKSKLIFGTNSSTVTAEYFGAF